MQQLKKKVLIIDDDSRNIFALTAVLKSKGFQTLSAPGMTEAFAILDNEAEVGIILLDMMMPDMDGYQALPQIKKEARWAAIPVIAVTAQAMTGDRDRCLAAGADAYLSKPVDVDQLMYILNERLK
jgi:CheY-like chemotaxis protein